MEDTNPPRELTFSKLFPSNTALLILGLFAVVLFGAWNFYVRVPQQNEVIKTAQPTPSTQPVTVEPTVIEPSMEPQALASPLPVVDARLTGVITEANNGCFVDGICSITIGTTTIVLETGGDRMIHGQQEKGILVQKDGITPATISDFVVGKKVQVYANKTAPSTLSLYGKNQYFVKLLN